MNDNIGFNQDGPIQDNNPERDAILFGSDEDYENWLNGIKQPNEPISNNEPNDSTLDTPSEPNIDQNVPNESYDNSNNEPLDNNANDTLNEPLESDNQLEDNDINQPSEQTYKIKADGKEFEFTTDELVKLAPKAMNYTRKMQQIAPFRKMIAAIEENGISEQEINQFIEMRNGNTVAIGNFLKNKNINTSSVDEVSDEEVNDYRAKSYGREPTKLDDIDFNLKSSEYYGKLTKFVSTLDDKSKEIIRNQPDTLNVLVNEMNSGYFDRINSLAEKKALLDGDQKSKLEYYIISANELYEKDRKELELQQQQTINKQKMDSRSKASISGKGTISNKPKRVIEQIEDISEDDFEAWYNSLNFNK